MLVVGVVAMIGRHVGIRFALALVAVWVSRFREWNGRACWQPRGGSDWTGASHRRFLAVCREQRRGGDDRAMHGRCQSPRREPAPAPKWLSAKRLESRGNPAAAGCPAARALHRGNNRPIRVAPHATHRLAADAYASATISAIARTRAVHSPPTPWLLTPDPSPCTWPAA